MLDRIQVVRFTVVLVAIVSLALSLPARPRPMEDDSAAPNPTAVPTPAQPAPAIEESRDGQADAAQSSSDHRPEAMNLEIALASSVLRGAAESAPRFLALVAVSRSLRVAGVPR